MKVINSSSISSFGGLNFVLQELDQLKIPCLLHDQLPLLPPQSKYCWKDLLYSFWSVFFCGGDCAEDLALHLRPTFKGNPLLQAPSADRVLERMKSLSLPSEIFTAPRGTSTHKFSINLPLNRLNIKLLKRLSAIQSKNVILDYDNTVLFTKKADAAKTYLKRYGYAPGVGVIGNNIVYVENRNGNSAAANLQEDTLLRMFELLNEQNISVERFRADGASYKLSVLNIISKNAKKFYIRANMSHTLDEVINQIENWEEVKFEDEIGYRGSIMFTPFEKIAKRSNQESLIKPYRLVVTKIRRIDGQSNLFTKEPYNYHAVLTNDYEMSNREVIDFYNQRGAIEREFDVLKNDFGWNRLPFSKLNQNTVYLLFTAMCRNIYQYIICSFSRLNPNLSPHYRIKKFIFRFICIPAKWITRGKTKHLRIYGNLAFKT